MCMKLLAIHARGRCSSEITEPGMKAETGRHYFVIYNTSAGRLRYGAMERLSAFFQNRKLAASFSTIDACDWSDVRAKLNRGREVRFVVAAGDGTLRLTLERLWQRKLLGKVAVAFVPLGSANIAALSLGLPRAMSKALELAVSGTPRPVDLGLVDNRHVFFIAAIFGAVSDVTVRARREFKERFGIFAYLLCLDRLLLNDYRGSVFRVSYDEDGKQQEVDSHSLIVCNQLNIGNLKPARHITADDKRLDLITLHNTRFWGLFTAAWEFFRGQRDSRVLRHRPIERTICKLTGFKGHVHLDGDECLDLGETIDFRVMPHAARIVT